MITLRRPAVRQADVRRVVRAAQAEGLMTRAIRVETTGEVIIDVGDLVAEDVKPLDEWRDRHGAASQRH